MTIITMLLPALAVCSGVVLAGSDNFTSETPTSSNTTNTTNTNNTNNNTAAATPPRRSAPAPARRETPLMLAAWSGDIARVNSLLRDDATMATNNASHVPVVDSVDRNGSTALMLAAWHGNAACAQALLDAGADVNVADNLGLTAVMAASGFGYADRINTDDVVSGSDGGDEIALMRAAGFGDVARLSALLAAADDDGRRRASVDVVDQRGASVLVYAIAYGGLARVRALLVEGRASVDYVGAGNKRAMWLTPLMVAAAVGDASIVRALLAAGADVDAVGLNGATPLVTAARRGQ